MTMSEVPRNPATNEDEALLARGAGALVAQSAQAWLSYQANLLSGFEAIATDWIRRQRDAFDAMQRSIERMKECRDPLELFKYQQEFFSNCLNRAISDANAFGDRAIAIARDAKAEIANAGRRKMDKSDAEESRQGGGDKPMQRTAAE
jgi:hypothetical protein